VAEERLAALRALEKRVPVLELPQSGDEAFVLEVDGDHRSCAPAHRLGARPEGRSTRFRADLPDGSRRLVSRKPVA
jgi:hypothetical protein